MGNWTRPGASSIQLLSLGRRSCVVSGVKLVRDTWRYQLCSIVNWEIQGLAASVAPTHVCVWCSVQCVSLESEAEGLGVWSISLWSAHPASLCEVGGDSDLNHCSCEQQGFAVDREPCRRLGEVDYRARCPSVLNEQDQGAAFTGLLQQRRAGCSRALVIDKLILQLPWTHDHRWESDVTLSSDGSWW